MKELELEQGSPEWLEARKKVIGASEVASIMGVSPWGTAYDLWVQKTTTEEPKHDKNKAYIFAKGHAVEDKLRRLLEKSLEFKLPPMVVKHPDLEWCQASLDGFNQEHKLLVEMKYMGREKWLALKDFDIVPENYFAQCQYQMMAVGVSSMRLAAMTDSKLSREKVTNKRFEGVASVKIEFDEEYAVKMIRECVAFYKHMVDKTPPPLTDKDYTDIKDAGFLVMIDNYVELLEKKKLLDEEVKYIKESLGEQMTKGRMRADNVYLTVGKRKGSVDYSKVPQLKGVDLNEFRKKPTTTFSINVKAEQGS